MVQCFRQTFIKMSARKVGAGKSKTTKKRAQRSTSNVFEKHST